ncbi:response regulator transcription factor [Cuneatibacter sp. NSJ-177]|uniref:response regulator transcription factor n=1 Tax=Cuneatibacter sp. NSJ-177 TaxID=2931401 RepID=UPI001FD50C94|nr:response regulator transcription factor [Cuneatibacter sp. NSJ-177]MCJ7834187.1 response regulator transcription factor [Cuneatibacter sp. NSJ-177]
MACETVLIVDDDPVIQRLLGKVLTSNQLKSEAVSSGEEALFALRRRTYDLILLDITMGGMDGFQFLEKIRRSRNLTPVIIVSGKNEDYDTLYGLELGADDYITKPFNPVVLGAKVKAMIRRNEILQSQSGTLIEAGPFSFDRTTLRAKKEGQEILLSSKETLLFSFFLEHIGQVFSKEQLYRQIWGDWGVDENTVMVHINHLRGKIEENPKDPRHILTVRGLGYKFVV